LKIECEKLRGTTNTVETNLDDSINRSMRSTLIFRGIPELHDKDQSWDQTTESLIDCLKKINPDYDQENIRDDIERCHRGGKSEYYKELIINHNKVQGKHSKIFVDQMYSKKLTERRKTALSYRLQFLSNSENTGSRLYVKYPAKLMVKRVNSNKYSLLKEF